jgi:hypothetical protein
VTRTLTRGSIEVYSIPGYGAVEIGYHSFKNIHEAGESEPSKFVILWRLKDKRWQLTRVISLHVLQHTDQGGLDGVTYVDNMSGVVVDGKELGTRYEASALARRFPDSPETLKKLRVSSDPETPKQKKSLTYTTAGAWGEYAEEHQEVTQRKRLGLRI